MKCIEARRMVTPFVERKLSDKDMEQFLKHVGHCSDCMDELDIYFTMYKALDTLDSGAYHEYDFRKMLREELRMAHRTVVRHKVTHIVYGVMLAVTEVLLICSLYSGIELRRGQAERTTFERAISRIQMREQSVRDQIRE